MAIESIESYKKRLKNNQVKQSNNQSKKSNNGIESLEDFAKRYNVSLEYNQNKKEGTGLFKGTEAFKGVASAFDDGYQFGDITKTAFKGYNAYRKTVRDTSRDLATNIAKGFMQGAEGIADGLQYLTIEESKIRAKLLDSIGAEKMAQIYRNGAERMKKDADFNSTGALFGENENEWDNLFEKGWTKKAEENSVIGDFGDTVAQGVGNVAVMAGASYLAGGSAAASAFNSFTSGYGNARSEAARNGLDDKSAHKAGVISGFAEAISEQFFDGMPGSKTAGWAEKLTGKIGDGVSKYFGDNAGKLVLKTLNLSGEGAEEIVSNALNTMGSGVTNLLIDNNYTYGMENSRILKDGYQFGDLTKDTFDSAFSEESLQSFISATLTSAIVNGGSNVLNKSQTDKIINAYAKDNGITFEEAKKQLVSTVDSQVQAINPNATLSQRMKLEENVQNNQLDNMRRNIFVEQGQQNQSFQYKETDNEQVNNMLKNLSEISNNTVENHATAQMAEKLIRDLGCDVEFVKLEGNVNGYKDGNKIVLNLNSNELSSFVMGHETTHFLESEKDLYNAVSDALFEVATTKGKLEGDMAKLTKTYENVINNKIVAQENELGRSLTEEERKTISDAVVKSELTANYVGNFFTDEDFFRTLGKKDIGTLAKFSEFLKGLYYKVTGQQEKAQILEAQKLIRKVYQEYANNKENNLPVAEDKGVQYSISDSDLKQKQLDIILKENPMTDDYHTGIRTIEDIKTFEETINDDESFVWGDFSQEDAKEALEKGEITVYSSYPIEQGVFVSTSKNQARDYVGNGKIYSKTVPLNEVAWINGDEGQYANVSKSDVQYSLSEDDIEIAPSERTYKLIEAGSRIAEILTKENPNEIRLQDVVELANQYKYGDKATNEEFSDSLIENAKSVINKDYIFDEMSETFTKRETEINKTDNNGRELSKGQQEYFKNSKVRDKEGNLLTVFHGTPEGGFTIFDENKIGSNTDGGWYGKGFYFTNDKDYANFYARGGEIYETYLNIENPYYPTSDTISDGIVTFAKPFKEDLMERFPELKEKYGTKENITSEIVTEFLKSKGYDGVIAGDEFIAFNSNQIKNIDNLYPTENDDIDYSISNQNEKSSDYELYTPKNKSKNKLSDGLIKTEENLPVAEEKLPYTEPKETKVEEIKTEEETTPEVDLGEKSVLNNTIKRNSIRGKESAAKIARKWLNLKGTNNQEFKDSLDKYSKMTQEELLTNNSYEEIKQIVDRYSESEIVFTDEDVKEVKKKVRNAKIKITDDVKSQITDYEYFRKSNFGKLKLGKDGTYIDVLWQELSDMYPYYFDSEVTTESDMLFALSDFMNDDFSTKQTFTLEEDEITKVTNDVYETILDNALNNEQIKNLTEKDNELKKMKKADRENIRTVESVIGNQEDYTSSRAEELYTELKGLKKGVRASEGLSQILNLGYKWSDIKAALSNIKWKPGEQTNSQNTNLGDIESTIKSMINEEYQNKVQDLIFEESGATEELSKESIARQKRFNYAKEVETLRDSLEAVKKELDKSIIEKQAEYDSKENKNTATAQKILGQISELKVRKANIELDYNKRIGNLTEKVKNFDVKEETRIMNRAEYKKNLSDEIKGYIENASKWVDKKFLGGYRYARETAQRNMVDVAGDVEGNAINDYVFNPVQEHEASKNRRIKEKFKTIKELDLDLKEKYEIDGEKVGEDDLVRRYIENSLNKTDLDRMGADSNKIINAAETISDILESLYTDINVELKKMGLPEVEHRKDYFPHAMEEKQDTFIAKLAKSVGIDITNQDLPTEIAGKTDEFKPNRAWNGHLLRRSGNKTDTNAIGNLERYIAGIEDIIAHTEDIQKVRTLSQEIRNQFTTEEAQAKIEAINNNDSLSEDEKEDLIKDIYKREDSQLSGLVTWLDDYANVLSNKKSFADRDMERKIGRNAYTSMANIESMIAGNTIGGNASVSLTNFAPIVQALATTKGNFLVKASLDVMKNDIRTLTGTQNTTIEEMSDFLTNRFGTDSIGRKTWKDKVKNIAFKPMEIVDNFTSEVVVRAKYYENLSNGMETYEAMKKADKDAAKIMADRSKGALPTIFNEKNPIAKLITMFQVEPNNIISNYTKDMSRDAESKGQLAYQYTKLAVGSYVFNSILMGIRGGNEVLPDPIRFVEYLIKAITGDDEEKEKAGEDMLEAVTGSLPFVSNIAGLLGMEDVGRIPISSALPDLTELVNLGDEEVSSEYKAQVVRDEILKPLSYFLLPTGAAQVWKTVQGLDTVANGGSYKYTKDGELKLQFPVEDPDAIDYVKAGLFGKYSLDEAKSYMDNGFKSLTEKQVETYEEMNLPYEEYLEYINGISEAKKEAKEIGESQTEAVYDYIYNLPLADEDKNILLNGNLGNSGAVKDDNGYTKYVDSRKKTYWYDEENDVLYNRNYHQVDVSKLEELTQYSNEKDISNYGDFSSLEEFNYANSNPEKYLAITQITDYKTFNEYKSYIQDIEDEYSELMASASNSKQKTAISNKKKEAIRSYINSLELNKYQKLMLEKLGAGYSIKNYRSYLYSYINDLNISKEEKETIDSVLFN